MDEDFAAQGRILGEMIIQRASEAGLAISLAESCTAGLAADLLASIPGASQAFWGSFVSYALDAKVRMLGVDPQLLERFGAVSRETSEAMALGALEKSGTDLAVSVTGLAGPEGDGSGVPVGTLWIASARRGRGAMAETYRFQGERNQIRRLGALKTLEVVCRELDKW